MLQQLTIQNYALIQNLDITPHQGLNIITGETGAGKSILLGAIGLLLGNRADSKVMFDESSKCVVEGYFNIENYGLESIFEEEDLDFESVCVIRREIAPGGKSRAFVNDTPVRLELLKKIVEHLMDIHSQHDTLLLGSNTYQVKLIDDYAQNKTLLSNYQKTFTEFKKTEKQLEEIISTSKESSKELDFNTFLFNELTELNLIPNEQEKAEEELKTLENSEEIKSKLLQSADLLSVSEQALLPNLKTVVSNIEAVNKLFPKTEPYLSRLQSTYIELKDLAHEIEALSDEVEYNPEKIEILQQRLNSIYKLQQKHQVKSIEELLTIQTELEQKILSVQNLDENIIELEKKLISQKKALIEEAENLSNSRKTAAAPMIDLLNRIIRELGMPEAVIDINFSEIDFNSSGKDKVSILFSANKGVNPQELKNAASGGEFSRLMLAIKYILAGKTSLPTIIFDEIDTGISGEIALKVGKLIKRMAEKHQIMCITHMPQMAAQANEHYYVYKNHESERTVSNIRTLNSDERIAEIAQMIGGKNPSQASIESAKELIHL